MPVACMVALDEENRQIKEITFVRETVMSAVNPLYPFSGSLFPEVSRESLDAVQRQWEKYTGQKLNGVFVLPESSIMETANLLYPLDLTVSEEERLLMSEITGYFSGALEPYELMNYLFVSPIRKTALEEQLNEYRILCGQQEKTITAVIKKILQESKELGVDSQYWILKTLLGSAYHNLNMSASDILSYLVGRLDEWRGYEVASLQSPNDLSGLEELARSGSVDRVALELLRESWNKEIDGFLEERIAVKAQEQDEAEVR